HNLHRAELAWSALFRHSFQQWNNICLEHGSCGDQSARSSRHHGCYPGCQRNAADTCGKYLERNRCKDIIAYFNTRQQDRSGHADDRPSYTEDDAVDASCGTAPPGNTRGFRGKYALPDVLADEKTESVNDKISDDRLQSHATDIEKFGIQAVVQSRPAASAGERNWQH